MVNHGAHRKGSEYLAPAFKFDEEEHQAVLQEAAAMDRVLSGQQARAAFLQGIGVLGFVPKAVLQEAAAMDRVLSGQQARALQKASRGIPRVCAQRSAAEGLPPWTAYCVGTSARSAPARKLGFLQRGFLVIAPGRRHHGAHAVQATGPRQNSCQWV